MTRYKQQTDVDDDTSSVGSARTEDAPTGTLTVRYHMGSHWWKSRTALEKALLVGWLLLLLVVTILVAVLHTQSKPQALNFSDFTGPPDGAPCLTPECVMLAGTILSNMDPTVEPCNDFYHYACGGWNAKNSIPEGKPMWGTLNILGSNNQIILRNVLEEKNPPKSDAEEKARVFYRSCMDANKTIEKLGAEPLLRIIQDEFKGWSIYGNWSPSTFDMYQDITTSKVKYGSGALFLWGVAEDDKNSTTHILQFDQGGLTLLARNTYLNESEKEVLDAYEKYIVKVGLLLGGEKQSTKAAAAGIIEVERKLAAITTPDEERRDDDKLYHLMTIEELKDLANFMDWSSFINKAFARIDKTLDPKRHTVVYAKEYLSKLPDVLKEIQKTDEGKTNLHNYMVWQVAKDFVGYLSQDFREASKDLEKAQMGVTGTEDLWRQCVVATDVALGPALGAMYVRQAFPGTSKNMAEDMIKQVRKSFKESLQRLEWMDDKTKKAALEKADSINEMIGYPDYILNTEELDDKYKSLSVRENDFFQNNVRIKEYNIRENLNRLFKPVNKTRWDMSPPTVNAYYSPTRNNIVFPAGILQAPIFHQNNTKSLNYGAVGVVMGHELAHAFDDQGRKYDKNGNLNQWWRPETSKKFVNLTQCMVDQYSQYKLRGEHLNGNLTLGENIADNAGLKASYHAYQQWVKLSGDEKPLPGIQLSHSKLFFLGFAQVWCSAITKEAAHLEIMKDSHVPGEFRVYGSLSNSPDFAKVFNCPKNSRMNPEKKCSIW